MKSPPAPHLDEMRKTFRIDPGTQLLARRFITREGKRVPVTNEFCGKLVAVQGTRYPAPHVRTYLMTGEWPA